MYMVNGTDKATEKERNVDVVIIKCEREPEMGGCQKDLLHG